MTVYSPKDIPGFKEDVKVYVSEGLVTDLYEECLKNPGSRGVILGDVFYHKEEAYTLAFRIAKGEDEVRLLSTEFLIVGWYHRGEPVPPDVDCSIPEIAGLDKGYHVAISCNPESNEIGVFKREGDEFTKAPFVIAVLDEAIESDLDISLNIEKEFSQIREMNLLAEYFLLSLFAIVFGIFGGVISFFVAKNQNSNRRAALLFIGVLSTVIWFLFSKTAFNF